MITEITPRIFGRTLISPFEIMGQREIDQLDELLLSRPRGVIMLDLDGHLINEDQRITDGRIGESIQKTKDAGFLVCLNSARPSQTLREWQRVFGTDDPNFAEFGGLVDFANLGWQLVFQEKEYQFFGEMRRSIPVLLKGMQDKGFSNIDYRYCEDEEAATQLQRQTDDHSWISSPYTHGIYLNGRPRLRLGLRAFKITPDGPSFDEGYTQAVLDLLRAYEKENPFYKPLVYNFNPLDYSVFIHSGKQNKTIIWRILLSYLGKNASTREFYHLGDSRVDRIEVPQVKFLTVGNAQEDIKGKAHRVSPLGFTQGVVDNLTWIRDNH